jgi:ABC-type multidrug transport system ATPase subunit
MGVCPQFDLLWDLLTAEEHLELFGRIKGDADNDAVTCDAVDCV